MKPLDNAERPNPARGPASNSAPTNANNNAAHTVAPRIDGRHVLGQTELPLRHPAAYVSLYAPYGRRRMWWFTFVCPTCSFGHFGRVADEESVEGLRRAGCGRLVWLIVARVYRGRLEVAA